MDHLHTMERYVVAQPVASSTRILHNLPASLTALVDRQEDFAQILDLLADPSCRLITITGVGGVGKTRLALEVARAFVPNDNSASPFIHGVYFVPLATLAVHEAHDDALATTIAATLDIGLAGSESPTVQVRRYLQHKAMLLVLDNAEHLVAGAAFISSLLREAPMVKIVVASRMRLGLRSEWVIALDGLSIPEDGIALTLSSPECYSSLALFAQAAGAAAPGFVLTEETIPAVVRICRLVAGLPLGIELAASWVTVLSCAEIADEIEQNLDFLSLAAPDLPQRHWSLRAMFLSSWELLTPAEQQGLRQLSLLRGSFTREAAAAIAGAKLPLLATLVNKSLLRRVAATATSDDIRYEVLEPLRKYAVEQLALSGEAEAVAARHTAYYLAILANSLNDLRGPRQQETLAMLGREITHLRDAWYWAVEQRDAEAIRQAANALFHFYDMRGWFGEGAAAFAAASLALAEQPEDGYAGMVRGIVLARQGWFAFHVGWQIESKELLEQSLAILCAHNARTELVFPLNYLAAVCARLGDHELARRLGAESLALAAEVGDEYGRSVIYAILGQIAYERGEYAGAQAWSQQSLVIEQQLGNGWGVAAALIMLGKVAYIYGNDSEAQTLVSESMAIREAIHDRGGVAECLRWLGDIAMALHRLDEAGAHYTQSLTLSQESGNQGWVAASLTHLGKLALAQGQTAAVVRLFSAGLQLALESNTTNYIRIILAAAAPLVQQSGDEVWAERLVRFAKSPPLPGTDGYRHAPALLAWLASPDWQALTLEEAIAAALQAAPTAIYNEAAVGVGAPQSVNYPTELTAREIEVLQLVAQGLTDAQIAERLVISPRTVNSHLRTIYSKLEVTSRTAAARFAIDHNLV